MMVLTLLNLAVTVLTVLIVVRALLSWVPDLAWRYRKQVRWIERVTEPILQPFRHLVPPRSTGGIDISPVLAVIALSIARQLLIMVLFR